MITSVRELVLLHQLTTSFKKFRSDSSPASLLRMQSHMQYVGSNLKTERYCGNHEYQFLQVSRRDRVTSPTVSQIGIHRSWCLFKRKRTLRPNAKTTLHLRFDGVVPLRQDVMALEP